MSISTISSSVFGNTVSTMQPPSCEFHKFLDNHHYDYNEMEKYLEIPEEGQGYGPQYHITADNWGKQESIVGLIRQFEEYRDSYSGNAHRRDEVKYRFTELAYGISLWAVGRQSDDFKEKLAAPRNVNTVLQPGENQFLPVVKVLWGPRERRHGIPASKIRHYDPKRDSLANVLNYFYSKRLHPRDVIQHMKSISPRYTPAYDLMVQMDMYSNS